MGLLPSDMTVIFDASNAASLAVNSSPVTDGWRVDAAGALLTQATAGSRPTYDRFALAKGPGILFGGAGAPRYSEPTFLNKASSTFQTPFSITCFVRGDGTGTVFEHSADVTAGQGVLLGTDTSALSIHGPSGLARFTAPAGWNSSNVGQIVTIECDGTIAGTTVRVNNGTPVVLTPVGGSVDPGVGTTTVIGFIGQDHAAATPLTGAVGWLGTIWGRVQTAAERANIQTYLTQNGLVKLRSSWYLPPAGQSVSVNLQTFGDSISVAHGAQDATNDTLCIPFAYGNRAASVLGSRCAGGTAKNFGLSSARLTNFVVVNPVLTQWTGNGVPGIVPGITNVNNVEGGVNDTLDLNPTTVETAQSSAVTIYSRWVTVINQMVSDLNGVAGGPHYIIVNTITPGFGDEFYILARILCNLQLQRDAAALGTTNVKIVMNPIGSDALLGSQVNVNFVPSPAYEFGGDPVHPAKPGHEHWGGHLAAVLLSLGL